MIILHSSKRFVAKKLPVLGSLFNSLLSDDLNALFFAKFETHFLELELLDLAAAGKGELVDEENVLGNLVAGNLSAAELLHVFG